jgi:hypothetical protein
MRCKCLWIGQKLSQVAFLQESKKIFLFIFRIKNSKPFRVTKNKIPVDVINKLPQIPGNNNNRVIHIELNRNNRIQNQNSTRINNINLDNQINEED